MKWAYYNHVYHSVCPPHLPVDTAAIETGTIWKKKGSIPLVARYTSDFDTDLPTQWWFCIKDTPLDIESLKAKRRYELNKGYKNFDVQEIEPEKYKEELFKVHQEALRSYSTPKTADHDVFIDGVSKWDFYKVYGAFTKETKDLAAYALLRREDNYIAFSVLKADPKCERDGVNAAIIRYMLESHEEFLSNGGYIDDGERAIFHETHFQEYLEKYFGFRKAYCRLHMEYNPKIRPIMAVLYKCRKMIFKIKAKKLHPLHSLLVMEEITKGVYSE